MDWNVLNQQLDSEIDALDRRQATVLQAGKIHALFSTALGQEVLGLFKAKTVDRPVVCMGSDGANSLLLTGLREGENNFVRWIESSVKKGEALHARERQAD